MASYFITGASRGIGFEFMKQLSANPQNIVIGLVRNKAAAETKVANEIPRSNIHIMQGDLTIYESLKTAAAMAEEITGGRLDYLVASGGLLPAAVDFDPLGATDKDPAVLEQQLLEHFSTNVIGNIHLVNLLIPLILRGTQKKVIMISSMMGDCETVRKHNVNFNHTYGMSKAALNMAAATFSSQYARDGVLFLSICPGIVDTGVVGQGSELGLKEQQIMGAKITEMAPHFTGPDTPENAVKSIISVFENASVANGDGGAFLSHFGNKQWL